MARLSDLWKMGTSAPLPDDIVEGGLAIDVVGKRVYSKSRDGEIFEVSSRQISTFLQLADVPPAYGNVGQILTVNEDRNGLVWGDYERFFEVTVNAGLGLQFNPIDNSVNISLGDGLSIDEESGQVIVDDTIMRKEGNVVFTGNVTATSFVGDGSRLSGVLTQGVVDNLQEQIDENVVGLENVGLEHDEMMTQITNLQTLVDELMTRVQTLEDEINPPVKKE